MTTTPSRRDDWLEAGLGLLRTGGEDALTVDRLCAALGRTQGSFYHHFADISAYHGAVLGAWARLHTDRPIAAAERAADATERRRLYRAVRDVDIGVELAVHAWAIRSPVARAALGAVHERRIAYLAALDGGGAEAERRAEIEYAAFLGALHLHPASARRRHALMTDLLGRL
jgi:AcrR family transcriptional regulator